MSNSMSTLLLRNLSDVFGENDPVRRRAAIDEIFPEPSASFRYRQRVPRHDHAEGPWTQRTETADTYGLHSYKRSYQHGVLLRTQYAAMSSRLKECPRYLSSRLDVIRITDSYARGTYVEYPWAAHDSAGCADAGAAPRSLPARTGSAAGLAMANVSPSPASTTCCPVFRRLIAGDLRLQLFDDGTCLI